VFNAVLLFSDQKRKQAEEAAEKNVLLCHSERSEESLFDLSIREQTQRDSSLRSE
jgi:hypothetical protein